MKNPGLIFLISTILLTAIFTINAFADGGIKLQPRTDLPYGKVWYFRGMPVGQDDFVTYEIYLKKDRCHFWGKTEGIVHKGETLTLTLDDKYIEKSTPDRLTFKVSRADGVQFAGMTCRVVNNPEPETLDDVKAFLQIQFGASADIQ
jgi:hypothetical protein